MNSNHVCELTNESSQIDICSSGPKLKVLPLSGPNTCTNESVESAPDCQSSNPASTLHPGGPFDGPLQSITWIDCDRLAELIGIDSSTNSLLLIDSRSFLDYNFCHIQAAVNICCSKIVKRRLQQDKITIRELLSNSVTGIRLDTIVPRVVVYDQHSCSVPSAAADAFLPVLLNKLSGAFKQVHLLYGGFNRFSIDHRALCTDKAQPLKKKLVSGALSQPCISNQGPTRILPFLYLGSQVDAMNRDVLTSYNITYELNVSTTCPKPDFIQDSHFLRIPVNDNYSDKLLPHFPSAFYFLDKVRESSGCVLVHCLGGISRSATIAIAYIMRHMRMTSDDAYRYLKSKRATISPNFNFLGQLLEYEKQLFHERVLESKIHSKTPTPPIETLSGQTSQHPLSLSLAQHYPHHSQQAQHTLSALSPHHHLLHHHFNPQPLHSPTSSPRSVHPLADSVEVHRSSSSSIGVDSSSGAANSVTGTPSTCSASGSHHNHHSEPMSLNSCDGHCVLNNRSDETDECAPSSGHKRHCSLASGARKLTLNLPVPEKIDSIGTMAFI